MENLRIRDTFLRKKYGQWPKGFEYPTAARPVWGEGGGRRLPWAHSPSTACCEVFTWVLFCQAWLLPDERSLVRISSHSFFQTNWKCSLSLGIHLLSLLFPLSWAQRFLTVNFQKKPSSPGCWLLGFLLVSFISLLVVWSLFSSVITCLLGMVHGSSQPLVLN